MIIRRLPIVLLTALFMSVAFAGNEPKKVETFGGIYADRIKAGQDCYYHEAENYVKCGDQIYENISKIEGSATGTPAWLTYKNYIGRIVIKPTKESKKRMMPGSSKAILLFAGKPIKKSKR